MAPDPTFDHVAAEPGVRRIGQIAVPVRQLDRAVAFYRDVLGMRFLFEAPPAMAFFDCGGVRLYLGAPESPEFTSNALLYYSVDDIVAAHEAISERGGAFIDPPHVVHRDDSGELWMAFLKDSEGNHLALMEQRAD